jgi:hypothetical protein
MKKIKFIAATAAVAFCIAAAPALAQHPAHGAGAAGGAGGPHGAAMGHDADGSTGGSAKTSASSPTTLLSRNTKLDTNLTTKLQSKGLLPAGTDLKDACGGFKNLGQCIAAIHVSHNLNIPFTSLKCDMTSVGPDGTAKSCPSGTSTSKLSLGKSIQALLPNADAKSESKTGQKQSDEDIKDAESGS